MMLPVSHLERWSFFKGVRAFGFLGFFFRWIAGCSGGVFFEALVCAERGA